MIAGILFVLYEGSTSNNIIINDANNNVNTNKVIGCVNDYDCIMGGCSGQLCLNKNSNDSNIITTCEWRDEYTCFQMDNCLCLNNKCQWEENSDYSECINNI